jgi:adenylate cyclase class 2
MSNEYELKFLNIDPDTIRNRLLQAGYNKTKPETLMRRQTYHLPKENPLSRGRWGRVRDEGDKITATVKWYENPDHPKIDQVHENEIIANDWNHAVAWIMDQGFLPSSYQENTREAWQHPARQMCEVTIDTWPALNPYIEVEAASKEDVYDIASTLGFDPADGFAGGTEIIYEKELGIPPHVLNNLEKITFDILPKVMKETHCLKL